MSDKNIKILYYSDVLDEVIKGEFYTEEEAQKAIVFINKGLVPNNCNIVDYDGESYLNALK